MLIDTHSHIYLQEFDQDRDEMLLRAQKEEIGVVLMPAIDQETHESLILKEKSEEIKCLAMMGLHPCSVKENFKNELEIVRSYFEKRPFIAVGETGLDFYWDLTFKKEQLEAFQFQIGLALQFDIPVVIHSRNSINECIALIHKNQKGALKGVFHCFSGDLEQAYKIKDLGFYMGIGGVVTFKNSGLDKVMKELGLDNVVLETDAPYLAPVPFRGKRNECSYLKYVVEKLGEIEEMDKDEIERITTQNARKLFSI